MFRSFQNLRNPVTLFSKSQASNALKQLITSQYNNRATRHFDIEITEEKPTKNQLQAIQQMKGGAGISAEHPDQGFVRPVLVDWDNGRLAVNNVSLAETILKELHESTKKDI